METTATPSDPFKSGRPPTEAAASDLFFNPLVPGFMDDPYPAYAALREQDPVHQLGGTGFWGVSRYDDVVHVLKNPQIFSSRNMPSANMATANPVRTIINSDPPDHTLMRNLVNRAFTPRMVADLEPRIREITRALLVPMLERGTTDLVADLTIPLPVTIIAEILGVDPDRGDDFKRWSNAVVNQFGDPSPAGQARMQADRAEFGEYFRDILEERRKQPQDDLVSAVLKAEEGDAKLTGEEIIAFCMLLLIAGNETTTNLLGNAVQALLENPEQMAKVTADRSLIPNLVEEALRYDSPVQFLFRTTTQETLLGGKTIAAGNGVVPMFASANRDDARFPDASRFDITRNAQGHLAFGLGPHFCLGAPLARLEAKVALEELFAHTRNLERTSPEVSRIGSMFLRGLASLPLRFEAA